MKIYSLSEEMREISVSANDIKNRLPVGTVLYFNGYGDHKKVVVGVRDITPGFESHGVTYQYIDLDNYTKGSTAAFGLEHISEKKDNRIKIYWTDERMAPEQVAYVVNQSLVKDSFLIEEKARKDAARLAAIEKIKKDYSYLTQGTGCVLAAKNLRLELKKAFPGVKFSVKTSQYSGGNSIDIAWTDGPTVKQVEKISQKYQGGDFNGMEDIYEYSDSVWGDVFGDAKYVFEKREFSQAVLQQAIVDSGENCTVGLHKDGSAYLMNDSYDISRRVYALLAEKAVA